MKFLTSSTESEQSSSNERFSNSGNESSSNSDYEYESSEEDPLEYKEFTKYKRIKINKVSRTIKTKLKKKYGNNGIIKL